MSTNILLDFLGDRSNTKALGKRSIILHRVYIHLIDSCFIHRQKVHDLVNFCSIEIVLGVELRFANYENTPHAQLHWFAYSYSVPGDYWSNDSIQFFKINKKAYGDKNNKRLLPPTRIELVTSGYPS